MFENNRILIVDDNESIHDDFRKILLYSKSDEENEYINLEQELFGNIHNYPSNPTNFEYHLDFALQGQHAF